MARHVPPLGRDRRSLFNPTGHLPKAAERAAKPSGLQTFRSSEREWRRPSRPLGTAARRTDRVDQTPVWPARTPRTRRTTASELPNLRHAHTRSDRQACPGFRAFADAKAQVLVREQEQEQAETLIAKRPVAYGAASLDVKLRLPIGRPWKG